jgi:hypothetical protein
MLTLSGRVGEKTFKDELLSAEELIKLFGIDEKVMKEDVVFEMDAGSVKVDRFGVTKHPKGFSLPARYSATFEGNSVVIHYYENELPRQNGRIDRVPKKLTDFRNRFMQLSPQTNKEKIAYYALSPFCSTSPLYRKGKTRFFGRLDREIRAAKSLNTERDIYSLYSVIFEEKNILKLKRKARGIKIKGQSIPDVEAMGLGELQDALIKMAKQHPDKFKDAYESADTDVRGIVAEAINYGIINTRRVGADQKEVKFADEYGGDRIAKIDFNAKPETILYSLALNDWAKLGKRIEREVNTFGSQMLADELKKKGGVKAPVLQEIAAVPEDVVKITSASIDKMEKKELVELSEKEGIFFFDELNKNIHFRKADSSVDPLPFVEKVEGSIVNAIVAKVTAKEEGRMKTLLKKKYK